MLTPEQAKDIARKTAQDMIARCNARDDAAKSQIYEQCLAESMKQVGIPFDIYGKDIKIISIGDKTLEYPNVVQRYSPKMRELPELGLPGVLAKRLNWCPRETQKAVKGNLVLFQYLPDADAVKIVKEVPFRGVSRPLYDQLNSPITLKYDFDIPTIPSDIEWIEWNGGKVPVWLERKTIGGKSPSVGPDGTLFPGVQGTIKIKAMFYMPIVTEFTGKGVWLVKQKCNGKGRTNQYLQNNRNGVQ
jgi:hypothetical protein